MADEITGLEQTTFKNEALTFLDSRLSESLYWVRKESYQI